MDNLVVVGTYSSEVEASLAKATLAAAGIDSILRHDDAGGWLQQMQYAAGVKVLVSAENEEEARQLLTQQPTETDTD